MHEENRILRSGRVADYGAKKSEESSEERVCFEQFQQEIHHRIHEIVPYSVMQEIVGVADVFVPYDPKKGQNKGCKAM